MATTPGSTPSTPLFMRTVDDAAGVRVGRLLLTLGVMLGVVLIQRKLSGPDVVRTGKMRGAQAVKVYAESRIDFWADVAARAATTYQKARI